MNVETPSSVLDTLRILVRQDMRSAENLEEQQARYLVDLYYALQDYRIQAAGQVRSATQAADPPDEGEPMSLIEVVFATIRNLEDEVSWALGKYAESKQAGQWALSIRGVGPVLTAGLLAHIDMSKASSPSSVWRFAGLDPTAVWAKGQKRPHNAKLKVLCWKLGESWKRFSGPSADTSKPEALYCRLYRERKEREVTKNEAGDFAELAAKTLAERTFRDKPTKEIYESGKLPPGRLDLRATRYATKIFLSHFWAVQYEILNGTPAPDPWAVAHGGHVDKIAIPLWP